MNQAEEFFSDLKEWSERKLKIIQNYLKGFAKILGSRYKVIWYVDGFAGRGVYDQGERGSPVLAAETAQEFQQDDTSFSLRCINVEKDHDNYTNLCAETKKFGSLVQNYEGGFEENIDDILSKIDNCPAVFFIDPFGIKGTNWATIEKVLARKYSTDVWIRFDHKTILRLLGFVDSDAREAQGKLNTLQSFFGIDDIAYLRERLEIGKTAEERINIAVTLYQEQLEKTLKKLGKKGFAAAYPIISIDGQRKYHLIFAGAHLKAATLASNVVNGSEETFQHEKEEFKTNSTGQLSLFSTEITEQQVFDEKVRRLKSSILNLPKSQSFTREELHYALICYNKILFGKIGRRHLTQAIKDLLAEPLPKIQCSGTVGDDKSMITILE